jgi:hypothetical protein
MKYLVAFFFLLIVWWAADVWRLTSGEHVTPWDVKFAISFAMYVGSMVAVPAIIYLMCADALSMRFLFPWNAVSFLFFVACGYGILFAVFIYGLGNHLPTTDEGWLFFWQRLVPSGSVVGIIFIWRLVRIA